MKEQEFIKKYSDPIIFATVGTPLFPSVKMAQAALESYWGNSTIGTANNLFGIKATGSHTPYWKGDFVTATTTENYGSGTTVIQAKFRAYETLSDSVKDHSHILLTLSRYERVRTATTPEQQAKALQDCGYATDTNYANKLIHLINQYNLKELDKKKTS